MYGHVHRNKKMEFISVKRRNYDHLNELISGAKSRKHIKY